MYNLILAFIAMFLLSDCGKGSGTGSSDTGSISFNVEWDRQSAESLKSAIRASSDVCSDYGIETIHAGVFNSSNSEIASMDWTCSAHSGSITNVPVASNYTVYLQGLDSSGTITWQGSVTGISVTANTTASAGTITMTYIGSDSTPPYIVSFDPLQDATDVPVTTTITATFNVGMAPSTINTDTFTLFDYGTNSYVSGSVTYDSSTITATFTPSTNLSYGTMYMANMQAGSDGVLDYKGWGIIGTTWVQFTTEDEPTPVKMPDTNQTTSYTDTFGEDSDYIINPPSYTDNGDGTVTDNVTGLVWQKQDDATARTWADAGTYCSNLSLAGQTDWRLPSQIELISIIDNGVYYPSINTTFFPGTISSNYWSSTSYVYNTSYAWNVYFYYGDSDFNDKTYSSYVRCVQGGETTQSLTDNGNGTVTDSGGPF